MEDFDFCELFERGQVLRGVPGESCEQVYDYICKNADLPEGLSAKGLKEELLERERVMSTAVGNGIAIPHPRRPLVEKLEEGKIIVAYLAEPLDMSAPDVRKVYAMFVLLSSSAVRHIKSLTDLATLFKSDEFRNGLQGLPDKAELLKLSRKVLAHEGA